MTPLKKPLFWCVTGEDFGREVAASRKKPNPVLVKIQSKIAELKIGLSKSKTAVDVTR